MVVGEPTALVAGDVPVIELVGVDLSVEIVDGVVVICHILNITLYLGNTRGLGNFHLIVTIGQETWTPATRDKTFRGLFGFITQAKFNPPCGSAGRVPVSWGTSRFLLKGTWNGNPC